MQAWQPTLTGDDAARAARRPARQRRTTSACSASARRSAATSSRPTIGSRARRSSILSDALWRRRFAADPAIVGRDIRLNDNPYTVIGVMPAGFENVLAPSAEVWTPLQYDTVAAAGRPRVGPSPAHGRAARAGARRRRGGPRARRHRARPGRAVLAAAVGVDAAGPDRQLAAGRDDCAASGRRCSRLLGAVLLLLAIACVNVTNCCSRAARSAAASSHARRARRRRGRA